jgi:NADPH:quinone reductase-like Zn-dependent oxidoreductase
VFCAKLSLLGEHRDGTMAEFVCVPADNGLTVPDNLDFAQAAALGVNYLTAWRMLFTKAKMQRGETVLVFGVGGGVSLAALQIAKAAGARVLVTSRSAEKLSRATGLGADATVNAPPDGITKEVMDLTQGTWSRCGDREYRRPDLERSPEMSRSRRSSCHMRRNNRRSTAGRSATHLYPAITDFWFDTWESR